MHVCQKVYLRFINIPTLLGFFIPYFSALIIFYLLGARGEEAVGLLALFCGSITEYHMMQKFDIDPIIAFANFILGLLLTAVIIISIYYLTGVNIPL